MTASFMDFKSALLQRPPTLVAPETSFVGDNLSTDQGWGDGFGFMPVTFTVHFIIMTLASSQIPHIRPQR